MTPKPTQVDFIEFHQPALESGEYRVSLTQTLSDTGAKIPGSQTYSVQKRFFIAGERFRIRPSEIESVFPPNHSLGEHDRVLPHIALSRNTLPWERTTGAEDSETPWLALLLVQEEEEADTSVAVVPLSELTATSSSSPYFPGLELEPDQQESDKVSVLDIKKSLLERILPDKKTLRFMSHIRQGKDDAGHVVGGDTAVLMGARLPANGRTHTAHLVSLENRFHTGMDGGFDYQNAGQEDAIRLVRLHGWQFTSTEHFKVSDSFLTKAGDLPEAIKGKLSAMKDEEFFTRADFLERLNDVLTPTELSTHQTAILADFSYGDFTNILKHLDRSQATLRLPSVGNEAADSYLKMGCYPLPHSLRRGARTVSWYRGPLGTGRLDESLPLPTKASDALLRYDQTTGMFDVSYAAAWELGRLLALQNTCFSVELYQWKRRYAKCVSKKRQRDDGGTAHLQGGYQDCTPEPLSESLESWLTDLSYLKGIPFPYLVPDEALLPAESIRFFQLDRAWIEALLDGAFSVGRVTEPDHLMDKRIAAGEAALTASTISGFILRSQAVPGWPDLQVDGYRVTPSGNPGGSLPDSERVAIVRREELSNNVLLCLFSGDLQTLDLHLKPEALHHGVNLKEDGSGYEKELRDGLGRENSDHRIAVPFDAHRNLKIEDLLSAIQSQYHQNPDEIEWVATPTSAHLALQLLEGVDSVRFLRG